VLYVEGLKHNLLSISQLCDRGYQVTIRTNSCEIRLPNSKDVLFISKRSINIYLLDIYSHASLDCLLSKHEESWFWHRRLDHIHTNHLHKLVSNELVYGLPKLKFEKEHVCCTVPSLGVDQSQSQHMVGPLKGPNGRKSTG